MKKRFRIITIILIVVLTASSCIFKDNDEAVGGGLLVASVIADMSRGTNNEDLIKWQTYYSYQEITAENLIDTLSSWTGLDFKVTVSYNDDNNMIIDWAADSTLVTGLDDREQKEEFRMYDNDSMRWFMMDSMWQTMTRFNGGADIYYTMDGGKELQFDELDLGTTFDINIPYMGSAFYYAHADVKGDDGSGDPVLDQVMDILYEIVKDKMTDETALVHMGSIIINDQTCVSVAFGKSTPEKFTAEEHYAVTDSGEIYILNIITGEYEPFAMG